MVFKTGDEEGFEGTTEDEFEDLEVGDVVRHVHDAEDETREVVQVGDHNPLAGGRMSVEVTGGTIGRNNIEKWEVVSE